MSLDNIILHERSNLEGVNNIRTKDTFVLTRNGWKPLFMVQIGDEILASSIDEGLEYTKVLSVYSNPCEVVLYKHSFWEYEVGINHNWFGYRRMTLSNNKRVHIWDRRSYDNLTCEFHILNNPRGYTNTIETEITEDECSLLGWLLSDGCIRWKKDTKRTSSSSGKKRGVTATVTQNDNKHGREIKDLMIRLGGYLSYYKRKSSVNPCRNYYLKPDWFRKYWIRLGFEQQGKFEIDVVKFLLEQPNKNVEAFMDAFQKADGHYSRQGKKILTQNESNISEGILTASFLLGYNVSSGSKGYYQNNTGKTNKCMWYKLQTKPHQTSMRMKTHSKGVQECTSLTLKGNFSCFITRQGDTISCT